MPPDNPNKLLPALHHALSGSTGTLISTCVLYPLSLVITRLQVQRQLRREGKLAPAPPTHPSAPADAEQQQQPPQQDPNPAGPRGRPQQQQQPDQPQQQSRQHPQEYAGIADAFSRIWRSDGDGGPRAFYTGLAQDAAKSVLDSFLFFLFYEWFRSVRLSSGRKRGLQGRGLGVLEELAVGTAAGACSRALTTPIANIVTRKQTLTLMDAGATSSSEISVREIADGILREKGIAGFWSGYSASLVLTLNPSITFFLQDFLKKSVVTDDRYDDPGPRLTFLLAATSKAVSSLITYPFQIAKTRLQAGVPIEPEPQEGGADEESEEGVPQSEKGPAQEEGGDDVDKEVELKLKGVRAVQQFAKQSVFGIVAQIVRTEGVGSLYDGIHGELLKGFFSHGTTMVSKGLVHKLLFKFYLFALGILAELRQRRARTRAGAAGGTQELPIALRYRIDRSQVGKRGNTSALDYGLNVVANLVDGTQRGVGKD